MSAAVAAVIVIVVVIAAVLVATLGAGESTDCGVLRYQGRAPDGRELGCRRCRRLAAAAAVVPSRRKGFGVAGREGMFISTPWAGAPDVRRVSGGVAVGVCSSGVSRSVSWPAAAVPSAPAPSLLIFWWLARPRR